MSEPSNPVSPTNLPCAYSKIITGKFDESKLEEVYQSALLELGGNATCVFLFVSPDWLPHIPDLIELSQIGLRTANVVGCSADGIIGRGKEIEGEGGCSLIALRLPESCEVKIHHIEETDDYPEAISETGGWIFLGNPLIWKADEWRDSWSKAERGGKTFGALASGGDKEEDIFIFGPKGIINSPALAVSFQGGIIVEGLVSQGCRPIGEPYTITRVEGNVIHEIGSQPAYRILEEAYSSLNAAERKEAQGNILVGMAMSEYRDSFGQGDFLVRTILAGDPQQGALALAAMPEVGQTLQFQLRDPDSADSDLRNLLHARKMRLGSSPAAGLLFTCTGRGEAMFGYPHHDSNCIDDVFPGMPLGGLFCNGEIGPVGGEVFLHGFSASIALFLSDPLEEVETTTG